ncbi:MAG TPA: hypothetical protein DCP28_04415, partial [Cytophagales bacterium]|nr:hypothetical protein [Cytophagales bacterium]
MSTGADKENRIDRKAPARAERAPFEVGRAALQLMNDRPEGHVQRKLHAVANSSPRVLQLKVIQQMADRYVFKNLWPIQRKLSAREERVQMPPSATGL